MAEASDGRVACPNCGKQYRWKPDLAGRKVVCKCGQKMRLPPTAAGEIEPLGPPPEPADPNEASTYDIEVPDEPPEEAPARPAATRASGSSSRPHAAPRKCPSCNQPLKPGAVLCVNCGYNLQSGQQLQTNIAQAPAEPEAEEQTPGKPPEAPAGLAALGGTSAVSRALEERADEAQADKVVEFYLPLGLIILGLLMRFAYALYFGDDATSSILAAAVATLSNLAISVPLALLGLIVSVKLIGVSFGPLGQALFKLLAILLGPAALGDIVQFLVNAVLDAGGWLAGLIVMFMSMWILLARLFDLDGMDALLVLAIMYVVNLLAAVFVGFFVLGMLFA